MAKDKGKKQGSKPPADIGRRAASGVRKAFCTECEQWYNANNRAEVNKHAH